MKKLDLNKIIDNIGRVCCAGFFAMLGWASYTNIKEFCLTLITNIFKK